MIVRNCKRISKSFIFRSAVVFAIVFSGILVGIETYPALVARHGPLLHLLDMLVLAFFAFEIVVKIVARGRRPWLYFYDPWNVFDFVIVAVCFLPFHAGFSAAFRAIRILRVLRLVTVLPRLQLLVGALLQSIPSIGYVSLLLVVQFYIYAVVGVMLFGKNDPVHFATLPIAMVSLFRVVTLEDWTDIMYIQMFGSDKYGYENMPEVVTEPHSMPIIAACYFISFVLLGTMVVLNLFVGVILNGMQELQANADVAKINEHKAQGRLTIADEIKLLSVQMSELQSSLNVIRHRAEQPSFASGSRLRKIVGNSGR